MIFHKTVSYGNDFLHVNMAEYNASFAGTGAMSRNDLTRAMCRRHTGAGGDGVVFYTMNKDTTRFEIFNQDGSEAELSGNGMAGLSALLFTEGHCNHIAILDTPTGRRSHHLINKKNNTVHMTIEIGPPNFSDTRFFPFLLENQLDYLFSNESITLTFYPVSVGNPHAVVILNESIPENQLETLGQFLESTPMFPKHTNVEFVYNINGETCDVFYYERGVGRTLSSSTGSAAVFAVLRKLQRITERLSINTPLGIINIHGKKTTTPHETIPGPISPIPEPDAETIFIENITQIVYKGDWLSTKA